jgi:hypothetical protein
MMNLCQENNNSFFLINTSNGTAALQRREPQKQGTGRNLLGGLVVLQERKGASRSHRRLLLRLRGKGREDGSGFVDLFAGH